MFEKRSSQLERIDTGDYTPSEYARYHREIRFINRYLGDYWAIRKTLLRDIERRNLSEFSVLDVGAGSGELLTLIARFARTTGRSSTLVGLDLSEDAVRSIASETNEYSEIRPLRADAFTLPFKDGGLNYVISSLFFHHLPDEKIPEVIDEMARVAKDGIVIIDLERKRRAWLLFRLFCKAFRISPLVTEDGALSIRRGFTSSEFRQLGERSSLTSFDVMRSFPYRIILLTPL